MEFLLSPSPRQRYDYFQFGSHYIYLQYTAMSDIDTTEEFSLENIEEFCFYVRYLLVRSTKDGDGTHHCRLSGRHPGVMVDLLPLNTVICSTGVLRKTRKGTSADHFYARWSHAIEVA